MSKEYTFPPYQSEMAKVLEKFGGKMMETYMGEDITPLRDLKGKGLPWSFKYVYADPKLEKIVFALQSFRDKLMSYATGIIREFYREEQDDLPEQTCGNFH